MVCLSLAAAQGLDSAMAGVMSVFLTPWQVGIPGAGALLAGLVLALDRMALAMIRPPKKVHAHTVRDLSFEKKPCSFSSLGQALGGWFLVPEKDLGGAVVVMVHGWGSSHGRMTILARPLLDAGYPVFLFDVRHHGEAPDAPFVTARHFREDSRAAVREMRMAYPERPLVLVGHSMGGSAAILAVAEGALVDGLVSVAAPADLWSVWSEHFERKGLPGRWIVRLFNPFWRYRAGVSFRTLRPEERVKEVEIPFLILHGDQDRSVPVEHARILARGAGVEPAIMEGAGHNDLLGTAALHRAVFAFLEGIG